MASLDWIIMKAALFLACALTVLSTACAEVEGRASNARQTIEKTSLIIDGRSYPVATKVTAHYHRALAYEQEKQFGKAIQDCKAALGVDDQVWYMNHDDIRAIRLIKEKARKKLEELEAKTQG